MKRTRKKRKRVSAESIARLAERGENVSRFFTNSGRMMPGRVARINAIPLFRRSLLTEKGDHYSKLK